MAHGTLVISLNSAQMEHIAVLNYEMRKGEAPVWIELIPAGVQVEGRDGRKWLNDRPQEVIEAFNSDGRDLVIDIEHSTEHKAPKGDPAPAVGWIESLKLLSGAVWGRVAWNSTGRKAIISRGYRYYSPVYLYERATGRIVQLLSVGLTNRPNLRFAALNSEEQIACRCQTTHGLNAAQLEVARMFGNTVEDIMKYGIDACGSGKDTETIHGINAQQLEIAKMLGNTLEDIAKYGI